MLPEKYLLILGCINNFISWCGQRFYSFRAIALRICEDSWKQAESLKIDWIRDKRFKTNLFQSGFVIHNTIRIQDSFCKARIEPFWSQHLWPRCDTIPAALLLSSLKTFDCLSKIGLWFNTLARFLRDRWSENTYHSLKKILSLGY